MIIQHLYKKNVLLLFLTSPAGLYATYTLAQIGAVPLSNNATDPLVMVWTRTSIWKMSSYYLCAMFYIIDFMIYFKVGAKICKMLTIFVASLQHAKAWEDYLIIIVGYCLISLGQFLLAKKFEPQIVQVKLACDLCLFKWASQLFLHVSEKPIPHTEFFNLMCILWCLLTLHLYLVW